MMTNNRNIYGLTERDMRTIQDIFQKYSDVTLVRLFGSRAKGNYKQGSDIDLAIMNEGVSAKVIGDLAFEFEESSLPYMVDLINYPALKHKEFIEHIDRVGIVFYRRWKEYKFSELLQDESISYGVVQSGSHTEINSVPIIRVNNIKNGYVEIEDIMKVSSSIEEKYKRTRLIGGELLITVVGSVGECAIVPFNLMGWNVARAVSVARIKKEFDKRYIKYAFKTDDIKYQMYANTFDTVQPTLNLGSLKDLIFKLPPFKEQETIATILSSLDDKIDLLQRQNKTLEQLAETLFKQWFVEEAGEDWEVGELGDVLELIYGKALKEEIRTGIGFPVIGSSGIVGYHSEYFVKGPGIIIGRKGTLGEVIYMFHNFFPIDTTYFVKSKINSLGLFYEYFLLKTLNFKEMNSDSAVPGLNRDIALSAEIAIAPTERLKEFNNHCFAYFEKIKLNLNQMQALTQFRNTLLPKLMSGEVRVKM